MSTSRPRIKVGILVRICMVAVVGVLGIALYSRSTGSTAAPATSSTPNNIVSTAASSPARTGSLGVSVDRVEAHIIPGTVMPSRYTLE